MAGKNRKENMSTSSGIKVVDESQVIVENQTNTGNICKYNTLILYMYTHMLCFR
jgi:hypothetical protein